MSRIAGHLTRVRTLQLVTAVVNNDAPVGTTSQAMASLSISNAQTQQQERNRETAPQQVGERSVPAKFNVGGQDDRITI